MKRLLAILAAALALPASAHAQDGQPIVGGGSFNTAPLLEAGTYADTVAAGETVYWKVKLAKGQILKARATVDVSQIETDYASNDYLPGLYHLNYELVLFTPLREPLSDEIGAGSFEDASAELEGDDDAGAKTGEAVSPRVLGFEQILADYGADKFPAPGEWYVGLSVADSDSEPAEQPVELPVDLEIAVEGQAQASSPDFASTLATPTPAATESATDLLGGETPAGDPMLTIALVAVLALLGGVGLGALAARVLVRT